MSIKTLAKLVCCIICPAAISYTIVDLYNTGEYIHSCFKIDLAADEFSDSSRICGMTKNGTYF